MRFHSPDATFYASAPERGVQPEDNVLTQSHPAVASSAASAAPIAGSAKTSSDALLDRILTSLSDDKAEDVVTIDLRKRSEIADFMVVASGRSSRQVTAIAEKLTEHLKEEFGINCRTEGKEQGDWVLVDTGDAIVHIFRPEVRDFYQLEKMWQTSGARAV